MASMTIISWMNGFSFVLIIASNYVSAQNFGILSNLYKKAAQENRPMILVLDNSNDNAGKKRDLEYSPQSLYDFAPKNTYDLVATNKQSALDGYADNKMAQWPYNVIQQLNQKHYHKQDQLSKQKRHGLAGTRLRIRNRDKHLRSIINSNYRGDRDRHDHRDDRDRHDHRDDRDRRNDRDDRDRRDDWERWDDRGRLYQTRDYKDRRDQYRNDRNRRDPDRNDRDRRDRDRNDRDRRDRDRDYRDRRDKYDQDRNERYDRERRDRYDQDRRDLLRALKGENLEDVREIHEKARDTEKQRALRSLVVKNLRQISNDLNCDAREECQDHCDESYSGKKKNNCEDNCDTNFECKDEKNDDCDGDDCDLDVDSCGINDDECESDDNPSTRGVKLEKVAK